MRQIIQNLKTGDVQLAEIPVPLIKPGHLLIQTRKSLVSLGTERMLLEFGRAGWINKARQQPDKVRQVIQKIQTDGLKATVDAVYNKLDQPIALGYSNVGVVMEVGEGVSGYQVGDRVVSNGKHAEVVCIPENLCAKVPESLDDDHAVFGIIGAIGLQGIRLAKPTIGEIFAVQGLGLIGLMVTQILLANGCRVIGFDFDPQKIALAKKLGSDAFLLDKNIDPVGVAHGMTEDIGVDGVIICASTKSNDPIKQAPKMCRKRGRIILVGVVGLELSRTDFYEKEISFQVSCSYGPGRYDTNYEEKGNDYPIGYVRWTEQRNIQTILDLMNNEKLKIDPLITEKIKLNNAPKMYSVISHHQGLGYILEYPEETKKDLHTIQILPQQKSISQEPVIGLIGAGAFAGGTLIPALKKTGARLKCIASESGITGFHKGHKFGFEETSTSFQDIINDPHINVIMITTRHDKHANLVNKALKAKKHVFVEKPLCLSMDQLNEITNTYKDTLKAEPNIKLMVGFNRRFSPMIKKSMELLQNDLHPKAIIITVNAGKIPPDHWTQDKDVGGGRIIGEACHFIDLIRFIVGHPINHSHIMEMESVSNDTVSISLSFQDGSIGNVNYFSNGHKSFSKERIEIFSGQKILMIDNFKSLKGAGWNNFKKQSIISQDKGHLAEIREFIASIKNGTPTLIPFEEIEEVTRKTLDLASV